jgi:NADPH-dependent 2,4-dienoyl-CoA reductase/sulfur reductase-like enzyme
VVVIGIGVRPDTELAAAAGLPLGPHGGVVVDAGMRTGTDGVWAAGDCCQTRHLLHDGPAYVPLGTTANKQGRVAGTTLTGGDAAFGGVLGTAVVKVCELQVGRTGLGEEEASAAGFDAVTASITHISRARYYPGHEPLQVKLVAERGSGRLLGGQLVGREGVAKRVDVVAAALHAGATADELAGYDLTYAPPFAPVWDPLLLAARAAAEAA